MCAWYREVSRLAPMLFSPDFDRALRWDGHCDGTAFLGSRPGKLSKLEQAPPSRARLPLRSSLPGANKKGRRLRTCPEPKTELH